jgi:hypothetical protein
MFSVLRLPEATAVEPESGLSARPLLRFTTCPE